MFGLLGEQTLEGYDEESSTSLVGLAMKILSINTEHTHDQNRIALNVDQEITPEFLVVLECGTMTFSGAGTVLTVEKPGYDPGFTSSAIQAIQSAIDHAQNNLEKAPEKRRRMLKAVAQCTGLQLDSTQTNQSRH